MSAKDTMPRPTRFDEPVRLIAAQALAKRFAEWANEAVNDHTVNAIAKAIRWDSDGYAVCRELESSSLISPDAELVDIMDGASHELYAAKEDAVKQWVKYRNITLEIEVGARVSTPHGEGIVVETRPEVAIYIVKLDGDQTQGYSGHLIEAEKVVRALASAEPSS